MSTELRKRLFENYLEGQGKTSSGKVYANPAAQWPYYDANYSEIFAGISRDVHIVEIGSGPGSLLAWLQNCGFQNLKGVDASPGDVAFANSHLQSQIVELGDGKAYLRDYQATFDVIVMKATLEHQPKDELLEMIGACRDALKPDGLLIIDVPNMDWLVAMHERYMDLTHEIGFTRESLRSLLGLFFNSTSVVGSVPALPTKSQRLLRKPFIRMFRFFLYVLGEGASDVLFESRSIIAVAQSPLLKK
jgi:2-polyprenyl-3-methyl-5-hydroxy-6-metoxy-1,4-benzoquinol methylase